MHAEKDLDVFFTSLDSTNPSSISRCFTHESPALLSSILILLKNRKRLTKRQKPLENHFKTLYFQLLKIWKNSSIQNSFLGRALGRDPYSDGFLLNRRVLTKAAIDNTVTPIATTAMIVLILAASTSSISSSSSS